MKIAVITWFHYQNYGTALQVSAMSEILRQSGHEADIIHYIPKGYMARSVPDYSVSSVCRRALKRFKPPAAVKSMPRHFSDDSRSKAFDVYLSERLTFTPECTTLTDLCELNEQYDAFICGSDQIWSPNNFDAHYFLDFVSSRERMIAYAPSIGLPKIENRFVSDQMRTLIKRFEYLSVREIQGKNLIKQLTGKEAEMVCDPTVLLTGDEWRVYGNVPKYSEKKTYLLAYMLGSNELHWKKISEIASDKKLELKIIPVFKTDLERDGCIKTSIGPQEFLTLIDGAEIICTDSFHGMVFSLLFQKIFVPFERFCAQDPINQNSRVYNLLSVVNLSEHLIDYNGDGTVSYDFNFEKINNALSILRKSSRKYLFGALDKISHLSPYKQKKVLSSHSLCCGCGACERICPVSAIQIKLNEFGFMRAYVKENSCINCGKCLTVCPLHGHGNSKMIKDYPLYSYKDADEDILKVSSSGGFAYALAKQLLEKGYAIAGCTFDSETQTARHLLIHSENELKLLQGSKYMQSEFSHVLQDISSCQSPVAIFGLPCQISAARKLFADRSDIVYIDLICHGVPTYNLYKKYKSWLSEKYGLREDRIYTQFRYKPNGWREIYLHNSDGIKSVCLYQKEDPYFRLFETGSCYNECCYECRWRDCSDADIRIGDYWGPRFEKDKTGVSMVAVISKKGNEMLEILRNGNNGAIAEQPVEDYLKYQQTKNELKPLYYSELIDRLNNKNDSIMLIADKYSLPFEKQHLTKTKRYSRILKLILADSFYYIQKEKKQ